MSTESLSLEPPSEEDRSRNAHLEHESTSSGLMGFTRKRHAIIVGVNKYKSNRMSLLNFCVTDAISMEASLVGCKYEHDCVVLMHTGKSQESQEFPNENNIIRTIIKKLIETRPDDLLLVYFAGHGDLLKDASNDMCLAAYDYDPQNVNQKMKLSFWRDLLLGRKFEELQNDSNFMDLLSNLTIDELKKRVTQRVVLMIDACHAGADLGHRDTKDSSVIWESKDLALGFVQISASTQNQKAYEYGGHGIFTRYVCKVFDDYRSAPNNGPLHVSTLVDRVFKNVVQWTKENHYPLQTPSVIISGAGDIYLADLQISTLSSTSPDTVKRLELVSKHKAFADDLSRFPEAFQFKLTKRLDRARACLVDSDDLKGNASATLNIARAVVALNGVDSLISRYRCYPQAWDTLFDIAASFSKVLESEIEQENDAVIRRYKTALLRRLNYARNRVFSLSNDDEGEGTHNLIRLEDLANHEARLFRNELDGIWNTHDRLCEFRSLLQYLETTYDLLPQDDEPLEDFKGGFKELTPAEWDESSFQQLFISIEYEISRLLRQRLRAMGKKQPPLVRLNTTFPLVPDPHDLGLS